MCKAKDEGSCVIDKTHRNQCRACRLQKCQEAGMNKDAVQHERGPRNSTLRRQQMSSYFGDSRDRFMSSPTGNVLNLTMPKSASSSPLMESVYPIGPSAFICNNLIPVPRVPQMPLMAPLLAPTLYNPASICESAARLLFMNVQWAGNVSAFTALPLSDQLTLLEESWRELFVLGAAQFLPIMFDMSVLVHGCGLLQREPDRTNAFLRQVKEFQEALAKIHQFQMDQHEFACLRAIALFRTTASMSPSQHEDNDAVGLKEAAKIAVIQDDTQLTLNKYIGTAHPGQPLRFGKLLMLLSTFRTVNGNTIEELFFRKTIGHIPIVRIICDMYRSQFLNKL